MKKKYKIILIVLAVILIVCGFIGYQIYQNIAGSEDLTGKVEKIPGANDSIPPVTKGESDWPNWRGLNLDGKSNIKGIITDWSKGLQKLWQDDFLCQDNATPSWSAPVVQGNRLVVPGRDEKNDLIFCINSETGKLIWKQSFLAANNTSHGPGARASAIINEDKVYTFGRGGDVACWQLSDGKQVWRKNVNNEGGSEPMWGYSSTPYVYNNELIVQGGGNALIIAYDKINGKVLWKSMEGEGGYAAIMPINFDTLTKLLVYHGTGLSCINPENGKELWRVPWEPSYFVNATTPIVSGNMVFHTSGYDMGGELLKVSVKGYKVLWKNNVIEAQHSDQILIDGYLYGYTGESTNKGPFKCVEFKTGKEMWSTKKIGGGTCIFADGYLICLDVKGNLYLVKPNIKSFVLISKFPLAIKDVKSFAWTSPIIANDRLYLRYMQTLICYKIKN